jgi:UPF0176 protein
MKDLSNKINKEELKNRLATEKAKRITLSFYRYVPIINVRLFRDHLYTQLEQIKVFGRIYIAEEGINGQLSIPERMMIHFKKRIEDIDFLSDIRYNYAIEDDGKSFYVLKVKIRPKIVADGLDDDSFNVADKAVHINAQQFNELTDNPDTIIVDMRNHYESEVGHFENAICPDVETFREALPVVDEILKDEKDKNIIMYCTGGIRCEKASAYYRHKGFSNVFQLDGGIIEYAREVEKQGLRNKFKGKNFVFDERMGEQIGEEVIAKCHQCGESCDTHINCANHACHILFIQCKKCRERYHACCSDKCKSFIEKPEEEQSRLKNSIEFNGTRFGKGRYKAHLQNEQLNTQ